MRELIITAFVSLDGGIRLFSETDKDATMLELVVYAAEASL